MASPFSIFRKNQRVWMAILVFVAVVSFVILPSMDSFLSANRNAEGQQTVVSWKGTRLTAEQLQKQTAVQAQTYNVFARIATEVVAAGGTPRVPGYSPGPQGGIGLQPPTGRAGVVELKTLAEVARENGVVVNDETVDLFIRNFTDGKISPKKFGEIVEEVAGKQLSRFDMYSYLRDEISKQLLVQMGLSGFTSSSQPLIAPSKNWLNFQKLQQRAKVEVYPLFIEQFVEKVTAKPNEPELKALYEKGKDLYSIPSQPEPGFRRRYKADFEFLFADFNALIKEEQAKITPEALEAEYKKRVEAGSFKVPVAELKPTENATPIEDTPTETPSAEKISDDSSSSPEPTVVPEPETTEPPADSPTTEPVSPPPAATPETSSSGEGKSSQSPRRSRVRLVAFQEETPETPAIETAEPAVVEEAAKAAEVASPTEPTATAEAPIEEPMTETTAAPATPTPPDATSATNPETPNEVAAPGQPVDSPSVSNSPEAPIEKPMRVQTLDEVREQLLREMALPGARTRAQEMVEKASIRMSDFSAKRDFFEQQDKRLKSIPEPELLDLKALATEIGMTYGRTGLVDNLSINALPIGQSYLQLSNPGARSNPFASFPEYALMEPRGDNGLRVYQPQVAQSLSADASGSFVFWKLASEPSRVPTFQESREELTQFWKHTRAQELAQKAADEIAAKINALPAEKDTSPWTEVLEPQLQSLVMSPSPFTWLLPMMTGTEGAQLSSVEGIDLPGQGFMEQVFTGPVGKAVVAFDSPRNKSFVVRVVERLPTDDDLRIQFERSPLNRGVSSLANQQSMNMVRGWFSSLLDSIGLETRQLEELE